MQAELRDQWADALESGEYEQSRARLHDCEGRHCCLGVLCRVVGLEEINGRFWYEGDSSAYVLTSKFCEAVGLSYVQQQHLITRNSEGSFPEIAQWIRKNL